MAYAKRVLVFGSSGVGKTSLLNSVTGENQNTTSAATGCTFETTYYKPVRFENDTYEFVDTVGLNEGSFGTLSKKNAISNLINLILRNKTGFNLLVMVIKCGRIDEATEHQYKLFVKQLAGSSVPVILVVTHCENEESVSAWTENSFNHAALSKYAMNFSAIIGTTSAYSQNPILDSVFKKMRTESKEKFLIAVKQYSLQIPQRIVGQGPAFLFQRICRFIAQLMNLSSWDEAVSSVLTSSGFSVNEVVEIEQEFTKAEEKSLPKMINTKRVLIFGSDGVGKTSLLNSITGDNHSTCSNPRQCTFEATYYNGTLLQNVIFEFVEVAGFSEASLETEHGKVVMLNLIKLYLMNKKGLNLLVMVIKSETSDEVISCHNEIFVQQLARNGIPVILVVTSCKDNVGYSVTEEKKFSLQKYASSFNAVVEISFDKFQSPTGQPERLSLLEESKIKFLEAIQHFSIESPIQIDPSDSNEADEIYRHLFKIFHWERWSGSDTILRIFLGFNDIVAFENQFKEENKNSIEGELE